MKKQDEVANTGFGYTVTERLDVNRGLVDAIGDGNCGPRAIIQSLLIRGLTNGPKVQKFVADFLEELYRRRSSNEQDSKSLYTLFDKHMTGPQHKDPDVQKSDVSRFIAQYRKMTPEHLPVLRDQCFANADPQIRAPYDDVTYILSGCLRFDARDHYENNHELKKATEGALGDPGALAPLNKLQQEVDMVIMYPYLASHQIFASLIIPHGSPIAPKGGVTTTETMNNALKEFLANELLTTEVLQLADALLWVKALQPAKALQQVEELRLTGALQKQDAERLTEALRLRGALQQNDAEQLAKALQLSQALQLAEALLQYPPPVVSVSMYHSGADHFESLVDIREDSVAAAREKFPGTRAPSPTSITTSLSSDNVKELKDSQREMKARAAVDRGATNPLVRAQQLADAWNDALSQFVGAVSQPLTPEAQKKQATLLRDAFQRAPEASRPAVLEALETAQSRDTPIENYGFVMDLTEEFNGKCNVSMPGKSH